MTNRRRSPVHNPYRSDFLYSKAWFARRDRWFRKEASIRLELACAACGERGTKDMFELHHLDYQGVSFVSGTWRALERHVDLVALHPYCHELLHSLIDRDTVLSRQRSRRDASLTVLRMLRAESTMKAARP